MKHIKLLLLFLLAVLVGFSQEFIPKQKKKKWGFVNAKGEWVVKAKYSEVKKYSEGLACVRVKKKWGFINKLGETVIPIKYDFIRNFFLGLALVTLGEEEFDINQQGERVN